MDKPAGDLVTLLHRCAVRVSTADSIGSGFWVAPGIVITCHHVVVGSRGEDIIDLNWDVYRLAAQVYHTAPELDLALLRVIDASTPKNHPYVLLSDNIAVGDSLYAFGFSEDFPHGEPATPVIEGLTNEPCLIKLKAAQISPGFSGAPLLNLRTGAVCGMLRRTRDRSTDLGGRATPASVILNNFPMLQPRQIVSQHAYRGWIELLTKPQAALLNLTGRANGDAPWAEAARNAPFWNKIDNEVHLLEEVRGIVGLLAGELGTFHASFHRPEFVDPWRDIAFPSRVLARIDFLISQTDGKFKPSLVEAAHLAVAPYVHEVVWVCALDAISRSDAHSFGKTGTRTGIQGSFERFIQSHPRLVRRGEQVEPFDALCICTWLYHKWIHRSPEVWALPPLGCLSSDLRAVLRLLGQQTSVLHLREQRLLELARCVGASYQWIDTRSHRGHIRSRIIESGGGPQEVHVRERLLASLLALSGRLAIDIRRLPDIIAHHIGSRDPLDLDSLLMTIGEATWPPAGSRRELSTHCDHPASDLALREYVAEADALVREIHSKATSDDDGLQPLASLPSVGAGQLQARQLGDGPAYTTPHFQFGLSYGKIHELLMGEKIYGDARLAIRELYQNALDACRYVDARRRYLVAKGKPVIQWSAEIRFVQDVDKHGRPYIECSDNGIGMSIDELVGCFAQAGTRFVDLSEFLEEQAEWLACTDPIEFHPNSQFGIGVFSYFMLADEIEISTCRFRRDGTYGQALQVSVSSGGSLFRVRPTTEPVIGTTVRLYLAERESTETGVSCRATLSELLCIPDYETVITESGITERWPAGRFSPQYYKDAVRGVNDDFWWVPHEGVLLADGIRTHESYLPNCVINLRGAFRPELTVDRNNIQHYDKAHAAELTRRSISALNPPPDWLSFKWLWDFSDREPELADQLARSLGDSDVRLPLQTGTYLTRSQRTARIAMTGCVSRDSAVLRVIDSGRSGDEFPPAILHQRCGLWRKAMDTSSDESPPSQRAGSLVPRLDGSAWRKLEVILDSRDRRRSWISGSLNAAHAVRSALINGETLQATLQRIEPYATLLSLDTSETAVVAARLAGRPDATDSAILRALLPGSQRQQSAPASLRPHRRRLRRRGIALSVSPGYDPDSGHRIVDLGTLLQVSAALKISASEIRARVLDFGFVLNTAKIAELEIPNAVASEYDARVLTELPGQTGPVTAQDVIAAAAAAKVSVGQAVSAVERYWAALPRGVEDMGMLKDVATVPQLHDVKLLSQRFDGMAPWFEGHVDLTDMLRAISAMTIPPNEIVAHLRDWAPYLALDLTPIDTMPLELHRDDAIILSRRLDGQPPWIEGCVAIGHVLRAACELSSSTAHVVDRIGQWAACMAIDLSTIKSTHLPTDPPNEVEQVLLSRCLDGRSPWLAGRVSLAHVYAAAAATGMEPAQVLENLATWATLIGLKLPVRERVVALGEPDVMIATLVSENLDMRHPWLRSEVSVRHIARATAFLGLPGVDALDRLAEVAPALGLRLPSQAAVVDPGTDVSALISRFRGRPQRGRVSAPPAPGARIKYAVDEPDILRHALRELVSPREIAEAIQMLGITVRCGAVRLPDLPPDSDMQILLSSNLDGCDPFVLTVTSEHLFRASVAMQRSPADLLQAALPFASWKPMHQNSDPLLVPDRIMGRLDALWFDALSLDALRSPQRPLQVTAALLVVAANKMKRTLSDAVAWLDEIGPFLDVSHPSVRRSELPRDVPSDEMRVLFSQELNGQPPWIGERVSPVHLRNAAWVLGKDIEEIRRIVRWYSSVGIVLSTT